MIEAAFRTRVGSEQADSDEAGGCVAVGGEVLGKGFEFGCERDFVIHDPVIAWVEGSEERIMRRARHLHWAHRSLEQRSFDGQSRDVWRGLRTDLIRAGLVRAQSVDGDEHHAGTRGAQHSFRFSAGGQGEAHQHKQEGVVDVEPCNRIEGRLGGPAVCTGPAVRLNHRPKLHQRLERGEWRRHDPPLAAWVQGASSKIRTRSSSASAGPTWASSIREICWKVLSGMNGIRSNRRRT